MEVTVIILENMNLYVDMPMRDVANMLDQQILRFGMMPIDTLNHGPMYVSPEHVIGLRRGIYDRN